MEQAVHERAVLDLDMVGSWKAALESESGDAACRNCAPLHPLGLAFDGQRVVATV